MLRLLPVNRLSTHSTSWPRASSRSIRCEPRKPAPPVTSTLLRLSYNLTTDFPLACGIPTEKVKTNCSSVLSSDASYLFPRISSRASSARRSRARKSSADLVQTKGFGLAL